MLVAISRIVVGAHFFSDVLMGGTLAFVSMIIAREIFICKGAHLKAVFGKGLGGDDTDDACEPAEEPTEYEIVEAEAETNDTPVVAE